MKKSTDAIRTRTWHLSRPLSAESKNGESRAYYKVQGARVAICLGLGLIFICLLACSDVSSSRDGWAQETVNIRYLATDTDSP